MVHVLSQPNKAYLIDYKVHISLKGGYMDTPKDCIVVGSKTHIKKKSV